MRVRTLQSLARTRKRIRNVGFDPKVYVAAFGLIPAHLFLNTVGILMSVFWPNYFDYMTRKKWKMWL